MTQKIGIIGAGGMLQYHAPGFKAGGAEIVAICDMNQEAAKKAAQTYGAKHIFADSQKMLGELTELDAISIITPNRTHKPLAIQALQAGKHVFCEKPPALNAGEVAEMKQAAEVAGKILMFNFNNDQSLMRCVNTWNLEILVRLIPLKQNGFAERVFLDLVGGLRTRNNLEEDH
jgi:predicted dehydrogenase